MAAVIPEPAPTATEVHMIDGQELLIEIGRKRIRGLMRVCYFAACLLMLESAAFIAFIYHCRHH